LEKQEKRTEVMKTVAQLVSRWKYEDKHCPNYKVCFVKDKAHYLFSNEQNSIWAAAMIAGTHTVDAPPSELQGSVMTPRVGRSKASTMLATIPGCSYQHQLQLLRRINDACRLPFSISTSQPFHRRITCAASSSVTRTARKLPCRV